MYLEFIINQDGALKFGHVYPHKDLLAADEQCVYGGGLWKVNKSRGAILLRLFVRFRRTRFRPRASGQLFRYRR